MPKVCNYPAIYYSILHDVENLNEKEQVWFMVPIYTCCTWKSRPHPGLGLAKTSGLNRRMRRSSLPWSICGWWCGNLGSCGRFIRITNCKSELHKQLEECHARTRLTMPCRQRAYASMTCNCGKWSFPFLGPHQKTSFKANCRWMPHWEYQILAPVLSAPVCVCSLWHSSFPTPQTWCQMPQSCLLDARQSYHCSGRSEQNHGAERRGLHPKMSSGHLRDCFLRPLRQICAHQTGRTKTGMAAVSKVSELKTWINLHTLDHTGLMWTCDYIPAKLQQGVERQIPWTSNLKCHTAMHLWGSVSLSDFNCIYIVVLFAYKIISALCELTELRLTRRSAPWK